MKYALVTGGAGRIGREISLYLAESGYFVWVHYHNSSVAAEALCDEINNRHGQASAVYADLSRKEDIDVMFAEISRDSGLDLLVNNAAVFLRKRVSSISWDEWNELFEVNLRASWYCSVKAAEIFRENGLIVNMTDEEAEQPWPNAGPYCISKNALAELTRLLSESLLVEFRINAIAPGLVMQDKDTSDERWQGMREERNQTGLSVRDVLRVLELIISDPLIRGEVLYL